MCRARNRISRLLMLQIKIFIGRAWIFNLACRGGSRFANKLYYTDFSWVSQGTLFSGVFPNAQGSLDILRSLVLLDDRQQVLGNQFELLSTFRTGHVEHTLLTGLELMQWRDKFTLDVAALPNIDVFNPVETASTSQPHFYYSRGNRRGRIQRAALSPPYIVNRIVFCPCYEAFVGVRYDRIDYDDPMTTTSRKYNKLSPMAGMVFSLTKDLSFYANVGRAFAPPSSQVAGPRETEREFPDGSGREEIPDGQTAYTRVSQFII